PWPTAVLAPVSCLLLFSLRSRSFELNFSILDRDRELHFVAAQLVFELLGLFPDEILERHGIEPVGAFPGLPPGFLHGLEKLVHLVSLELRIGTDPPHRDTVGRCFHCRCSRVTLGRPADAAAFFLLLNLAPPKLRVDRILLRKIGKSEPLAEAQFGLV